MRVGFVSDLHVDFNNEFDFMALLNQLVAKWQLSMLVIAGDTVTGGTATIQWYQQLEQHLTVPFRVLPGNHDLYVPKQRHLTAQQVQSTARTAYDQLEYQSQWSLFTHPIVTKQWVITGVGGWYDYTFTNHYDSHKLWAVATNPIATHVWPDQRNINGDEVNVQRDIGWVQNEIWHLKQQLQAPELATKKICVVTHMLPTYKLVRQLQIPNYQLFTYQLGSERYRHAFEELGVQLSISGHSHMPMHFTQNGINYRNISLGYVFQWHHPSQPLKELEEVSYCLEVD